MKAETIAQIKARIDAFRKDIDFIKIGVKAVMLALLAHVGSGGYIGQPWPPYVTPRDHIDVQCNI